MATRCRSRTALVDVNPLALGNGRQPSVQVSVVQHALIFCLVQKTALSAA